MAHALQALVYLLLASLLGLALVFPPLSEERRKHYAAKVREEGETARIAVRNIRRDGNRAVDQAKKDGRSEDECFRVKDEVQKLTDEYEKKITDMLDEKTKEIMEL